METQNEPRMYQSEQQQEHISKQRVIELARGSRPSNYEDKHFCECMDCLRSLIALVKREHRRQELARKAA